MGLASSACAIEDSAGTAVGLPSPAMPLQDRKARERLMRIELLIEEYRRSRQRRRARQAIKQWRDARICRQLARLEAGPERVH